MLHDLFICHASEDKATLVRPLAEALRAENVAVWYDEFTLKVGDSIRRSIDKGLRQSRFGIVVLSKAFFSKQWPQYELDGFAEREMCGADKVMLPIWHEIDHSDVMNHSPSLAGRVAIKSSVGLSRIVKEILDIVRPQESPLIVARDLLLEWGITPPVITDSYWLDVVEASNRLPGFGAQIPAEASWDLWSFPLPPKGDSPQTWGERLAFAAMQSAWVKAAEDRSITLITPPGLVCDFIDGQPGLFEACYGCPSLTAQYAPQLTIRSFGGDLEVVFEDEFQKSCTERATQTSGAGLTTTELPPLCDEDWALRHPTFGDYSPAHIACEYFSGGIFGPTVSPYEHADHLFWLISDDSKWLPTAIRDMLIVGMREWAQWHWGPLGHARGGTWKSNGTLSRAMFDARDGEKFIWSRTVKDDLRRHAALSIKTLNLSIDASELVRRFIDTDFVGAFILDRREERARQKKNMARKKRS